MRWVRYLGCTHACRPSQKCSAVGRDILAGAIYRREFKWPAMIVKCHIPLLSADEIIHPQHISDVSSARHHLHDHDLLFALLQSDRLLFEIRSACRAILNCRKGIIEIEACLNSGSSKLTVVVLSPGYSLCCAGGPG